MKQSFIIAAAAFALVLTSPISATANSFLKLTQDEDELAAAQPICEPPALPHGLAVGLSEENAYHGWWERMDLERRLEEQRCDCEAVGITWEKVAAKAEPYLDMGDVLDGRTIHDLRRERKERRTELETSIQSMKAEYRDMCGATQ